MRATLSAAALIAALIATPIATLAGIGPALAQTTVIERDEPGVVVRERPVDVIERREVVPARPRGCESKTVTRTDEDGNSETVRRERCD